MTTTTYTPPATRETFAGSGRAPKLSFGGVLRSERIKLTSLRSFRITILITIVAGVGMSFLSALGWASQLRGAGAGALDSESLQSYLLLVSTFASPFLALIFGVLGVFAMSSEYSSGMILSTLAAVPRRSPMYLAKAMVLAVISALTALAIVVVGLVLAVVFLPAAAAQLGSWTVISGGLGAIVFLVCIALLGFGIAGVLRSTAGGISVVVGITFVLPIVFQVLSGLGWEWVNSAASYLPLMLGNVLASGASADSLMSPGYPAALIAILVWAAVPVLGGLAVLRARDAK